MLTSPLILELSDSILFQLGKIHKKEISAHVDVTHLSNQNPKHTPQRDTEAVADVFFTYEQTGGG